MDLPHLDQDLILRTEDGPHVAWIPQGGVHRWSAVPEKILELTSRYLPLSNEEDGLGSSDRALWVETGGSIHTCEIPLDSVQYIDENRLLVVARADMGAPRGTATTGRS
jgi:hypothetical protein